MKPNYSQCTLNRQRDDTTLVLVSYIPEPFCVVGKVLKLRGEDGEWTNGWRVVAVGSRSFASDDVWALDREYKHHRDNTDLYRGELKREGVK